MTNTEPVVTQEDRDAADQLRIYLLRKMDLELEDDVIGEFEKHFAANRTAAVAKREAEIVEMMKARADRLRIMASDDMAAGHPRYTAKHSSQARIIDELVKEIQTGGGA